MADQMDRPPIPDPGNVSMIVRLCDELAEEVLCGKVTGTVLICAGPNGVSIRHTNVSLIEAMGLTQYGQLLLTRKAMS